MIPDQDTFHTTYAVVDLDGGTVARGLVDGPLAGLSTAGVATARADRDRGRGARRGRRGRRRRGHRDPGRVHRRRPGRPPGHAARHRRSRRRLPAEVARSVLVGFGSQVTAVQVAVGTAMAASGASPDPCAGRRDRARRPSRPRRRSRSPPARPPTGVASSKTFYGASMAVMFVFFAAQFGVLGLLAERRNGTLARMLAAPIAPGDHPARQGDRQPGGGVDLDDGDRRRHDAAARRRLGRPAGGRRPGGRHRAGCHRHRDPHRRLRPYRGAGRPASSRWRP